MGPMADILCPNAMSPSKNEMENALVKRFKFSIRVKEVNYNILKTKFLFKVDLSPIYALIVCPPFITAHIYCIPYLRMHLFTSLFPAHVRSVPWPVLYNYKICRLFSSPLGCETSISHESSEQCLNLIHAQRHPAGQQRHKGGAWVCLDW